MTALRPGGVPDALPWGSDLLSNLEMQTVFLEDEHPVLYEWGSIFGSVSAFLMNNFFFGWTFMTIGVMWS